MKIRKIINKLLNKILIFFFLKKNPNFYLKNISGIIHIGANEGQEREKYKKYSLSVIWIEPIPGIYEQLIKNISNYPNQIAFKCLLTDLDNQSIEFKIANNNGASSSIFNLGLHTEVWPDVNFTSSISLKSLTLTSLVKNKKIDLKNYQALLIDTQGSELLVLKGGSEILKNFKYIITEAADFESYINGCKIDDLYNFLKDHGFKEVLKTKFAEHPKLGSYYDVVYQNMNLV